MYIICIHKPTLLTDWSTLQMQWVILVSSVRGGGTTPPGIPLSVVDRAGEGVLAQRLHRAHHQAAPTTALLLAVAVELTKQR